METNTVEIVDLGRGPQIRGHRLTVMDVFYYVHRGSDFDFIHRAMPTLSREEYDAVMIYIKNHYEELARADERVEQRTASGIAEQRAKGLLPELDLTLTKEQHIAQLRELLKKKKAEMARDLITR